MTLARKTAVEWVRNLPEHELRRIERQLSDAVQVARTMRAGQRSSPRWEPTGIFVPRDVEKHVRKRSA